MPIGDGSLQVRWIVGRGNGVGPSAITEALRALPITDETYVWVAGEAGSCAPLAATCATNAGSPPTAMP